MEIPSAADLVRVWELGRDRPSWFRGLLLLAPAFPGKSFDQLAQLTIGQRNIGLFRLREKLFGTHLAAVVRCPVCDKPSEFSATIDEICPYDLPGDAAAEPSEFLLDIAGLSVKCRCPNSLDLAAMGETEPLPILTPALVERCIEPAPGLPSPLSETIVEAFSEASFDRDPQLQLMLGIECSECGHEWNAPFDCVTFLWTELSNAARRLLDDVHVLASTYAWREADILAMSALRRSFYLERAAR